MQHGLVLAIEGSESQYQENRDSLVCIQGTFQAIFCHSGTSGNHDQTEIATVVCPVGADGDEVPTSRRMIQHAKTKHRIVHMQDRTRSQVSLARLDEHACPQNQHCLHNACHTLTRRCGEAEEVKKK